MDNFFYFFLAPDSSSIPSYVGPLLSFFGVLISGLIAIILFNRGIKKERKRYWENVKNDRSLKEAERKEEIKSFKEHMLVLIESVIKNVNQQNDVLIDYSFKLFDNPFLRPSYSQIPQDNLSRMLRLDLKMIHNAFINSGLSNKDYMKLLSDIDYINAVIPLIDNDVYSGNGELALRLANNVIEIRNKILTVATNYIFNVKATNADYANDPLWNTLNEIVLAYYNNNDGLPNPKLDYDRLIIPLRKVMLSDQFRYSEISEALTTLCKQGADTVFTIKQLNTELAQDMLRTSERIQDRTVSLENLLNRLENNAS